ncbi:hypothetical protein ACFV6E_08885 [Streptomyces sp. NPDC059785]|uniref:hypothetical protein n=1 Tax=Streptomyces sp. NPDC059785 TaxID=3346945 RepID=UPI00366409ED
MRCYNGDYHTDVFEEERLAARIASGAERVLFWGPPDDVARAAELFRTDGCPDDAVLDGLSLGTHTTLPGGELYGPGHIEVARTGSTQSDSAGAAAAIMWDLGRVLAGARPGETFHTISCVPRNRPSAPGIPGGAAIHRLHTRAIGSRHWGIAPFYVMAGGVLEVLDYRELSLDDEAVPGGFASGGPVYVSDAASADLVTGLCELNGFSVDVRTRTAAPLALKQPQAPRSSAATSSPHGPRAVHVDVEDPLPALADAAVGRGEACTVAVCDLSDERSVAAQKTLLGQGFRLTYISPPKAVARQDGATAPQRVPLRGGFCRIRTGAPPIPPYYLERGPLSDAEKNLASQYRDIFDAWRRDANSRV